MLKLHKLLNYLWRSLWRSFLPPSAVSDWLWELWWMCTVLYNNIVLRKYINIHDINLIDPYSMLQMQLFLFCLTKVSRRLKFLNILLVLFSVLLPLSRFLCHSFELIFQHFSPDLVPFYIGTFFSVIAWISFNTSPHPGFRSFSDELLNNIWFCVIFISSTLYLLDECGNVFDLNLLL